MLTLAAVSKQVVNPITYVKAKAASEEAADLRESAYATVAKGATDYTLKLIEVARTNTRAL